MVVVHVGTYAHNSIDRDLNDGPNIVLFKFKPDTSAEVLDTFVTELRKLKHLPCVHNERLVVGGPSITTPISRSKGYNFCLVSYHKDRAALDEYQASAEHHQYGLYDSIYRFRTDVFSSVTSTYMWPFNDDLTRFDFEMSDDESEPLSSIPFLAGSISG